MSNLLCVLSNSICIMGCHGNGYILYSPNEFFLERHYFLIKLVQVNKLIPMTNCPGGARYAKLGVRLVNILPILKMGGVILSGK